MGFVIAGEKIPSKQRDIDVSLNGTGTQVSGDMSQVTLDGDINVTAVEDSDSVYRGATGIDITGITTRWILSATSQSTAIMTATA